MKRYGDGVVQAEDGGRICVLRFYVRGSCLLKVAFLSGCHLLYVQYNGSIVKESQQRLSQGGGLRSFVGF